MRTNPGKSAPVGPFQNDMEYLIAELNWVRARSQRIGAERDAGDFPTRRSKRRAVPASSFPGLHPSLP